MGSLPPDMELFIPNLPMARFTSLLVIYEPFILLVSCQVLLSLDPVCVQMQVLFVSQDCHILEVHFFLRCALSLVLERFLLDLIGVSA